MGSMKVELVSMKVEMPLPPVSGQSSTRVKLKLYLTTRIELSALANAKPNPGVSHGRYIAM